jgi:hypothetical protein
MFAPTCYRTYRIGHTFPNESRNEDRPPYDWSPACQNAWVIYARKSKMDEVIYEVFGSVHESKGMYWYALLTRMA